MPARLHGHEEDHGSPAGASQIDITNLDTLPTPRGRALAEMPRSRPERMGHFVLLEQFGCGGMGLVYTAFDERLEREVAVKVLRPLPGEQGAVDQARLLREAQSLARLSHPNVVTVHEVDTLPDGRVFLAMELVKGVTLREWQKARKRTWRELVDMYVQAGAGLAAAHGAGIVHRDFKPENVLVGQDGRPRVLDFGLACMAESGQEPERRKTTDPLSPPSMQAKLTMTGAWLGTPGYMPPEQVTGHVDARTDQFSFCVALYEALYGERPYPDQVFFADEPPARRPRPQDVHQAWLWATLNRGLALAAEDRFPSMDALLRELTRDRTRIRRLALTALAVIALLATAGVALGMASRQPDDPCAPAGDELAGVWDANKKSRVRSAFSNTGLPHAESAWQVAGQVLDQYAARWLAAQESACRDAHEHRVQSEELLDLRTECLAERRRSLAAVSDVLASQPELDADRLTSVLGSLDDIAVCDNTRALRLGLTLPRDAEVLRGMRAVRAHLADGEARLAAGDLDGAASALANAEAVQARLRYEPTRAEIMLLQGRMAVRRGEPAGGQAILRNAVDIAVASHHDELVADLWLALGLEVAEKLDRPADGHEWLRHADAALRRLGHAHDERTIDIELARGRILLAGGRYQEAADVLARALGMAAAARWHERDPRWIRLLHDDASALAMLGHAEEALAAYRDALELGVAIWGPNNPRMATTRLAMAHSMIDLGRLDEAQAELDEAQRVYRRAYGDGTSREGDVLMAMTRIAQSRGAYASGLLHAERALAIYQALPDVSSHKRAEALNTMGVFRLAMRDAAGALAAYRSALAIMESNLGPDHAYVGIMHGNLGEAELALGHLARAVAESEHALAILKRSLEPDDDVMAGPLKVLGLARLADKQPARAAEALERALALRSSSRDGDPQDNAEIRWALARALRLLGQAPARRRELAEAALATYRALGPQWHERAGDITDWLAEP